MGRRHSQNMDSLTSLTGSSPGQCTGNRLRQQMVGTRVVRPACEPQPHSELCGYPHPPCSGLSRGESESGVTSRLGKATGRRGYKYDTSYSSMVMPQTFEVFYGDSCPAN
ncbi:hypothetical protein BsWGS_15097 [Bradybaena similaris]